MARAQFVADENVDDAVVYGLRRVGVDALTLGEAGRRGMPDPLQLDWAGQARRIIITHDEDYVVLAFQRDVHGGIGYCHQHKYRGRPGALIRRIQELHAELSAEDWLNRVVFL